MIVWGYYYTRSFYTVNVSCISCHISIVSCNVEMTGDIMDNKHVCKQTDSGKERNV